MKPAVLYLRVSTLDQTTVNQERELRQVAERAGWEITHGRCFTPESKTSDQRQPNLLCPTGDIGGLWALPCRSERVFVYDLFLYAVIHPLQVERNERQERRSQSASSAPINSVHHAALVHVACTAGLCTCAVHMVCTRGLSPLTTVEHRSPVAGAVRTGRTLFHLIAVLASTFVAAPHAAVSSH
jgi:hypothetical protein